MILLLLREFENYIYINTAVVVVVIVIVKDHSRVISLILGLK
jgi:hypothetical protein